jgi:myo-inositol 2-dehydrogenase / D-chiro-inositol 1-dehydrogenase
MRIAAIGCGKQGLRHLAALAGLHAVTGLVVADPDQARARAAAARFGAACAPSIEAVFADRGIDAVFIAAPTMFHLPLARRAIEARKHFLCEKPFGADAATARRVARDAAMAGIVGSVGYLYRFAPAIVAAREAVEELGAVASARFSIAAPGGHALWKHRREAGGGAGNELASHMVDLALWFFGPMPDCVVLEKAQSLQRRVVAGVDAPVDAEDRIVARLRGRAGVTVTIAADFAAPRFSQSLEVHGERGVVRASIDGAPDLYRLQAQPFIAAIAGGESGDACDLAEAVQTRELLDRMATSPIGTVAVPAV